MKAVVYETTGPSSVLRLVERESVVPGPGEVRVRVVVSGVNPTDWKARQGSGDGKALPRPQVPTKMVPAWWRRWDRRSPGSR